MLKFDEDGEVVDHKSIPNNEWAKYRKSGFEFATAEQVRDYDLMVAERAAAAEEEKKALRLEGEGDETGDGPLVPKDDKKSASKKS